MMLKTPALAEQAGGGLFTHPRGSDCRAVWVESHADRRATLFAQPSRPLRGLVVELHGSGLDIERHRSITRLVEMLVPRGIAVLLPQAVVPFQLKPQLAPGFAWNIPDTPLPGTNEINNNGPDDIHWITSLVGLLRDELNLCPLILTGYSGGARLASHLLVQNQPDWSAAALVAGLRAVDGAGRAPPPTISFHGVDDTINPYAGGLGPRWDLGVEAAGHRYALAMDSLSGFDEWNAPGVRCRTYKSANGTDALTLYKVLDCAHAWPGCVDADHLDAFGPGGSGMDASCVIADFIINHVTAYECCGDKGAGRASIQSIYTATRCS